MGKEKAIFAGGCFWGIQSAFEKIPGVLSTQVGFIGGKVPNPTYMEVSSGRSGHAEAVEIVFEPEFVSFDRLLDVFFSIHNPTQADGQGVDIGSQYRSAVFYTNERQRSQTLDKIAALRNAKRYEADIVTEVVAATVFYPAEEYHQHYHAKRGISACRNGCQGKRLELF